MDRVVREVAKSQTQPNNFHFHNSSQEKKMAYKIYLFLLGKKRDSIFTFYS